MYIETKHLVLAAVVSSIATFAWQRQVDADSALRWIDEAVNFFPMSDYVNFAGVDTLGMNLQKVRVYRPVGGYPICVDYVGDRGIHGHGEAGTLSEAVKAAAESYRQLQRDRGK